MRYAMSTDQSSSSKKMSKDAFANSPLPIGQWTDNFATIYRSIDDRSLGRFRNLRQSSTREGTCTGSGYQAAVLGKLAQNVYTIEIVSALAEEATLRLKELGHDNVEVREGDGWYGWPEEAPFDKIMVTATAEEIPAKLISQLQPGGLLVMPVGDWRGAQTLTLVTKSEDGESYSTKSLLPVRFVPMTGDGVLTLDRDTEEAE